MDCGCTRISKNEIRDSFAKTMHDVLYDVEVEPTIQLLQGESVKNRTTSGDQNGQPDIKANGQVQALVLRREEV